MTLQSLYCDWRTVRRDARLRRLLRKLSLTLDVIDAHERKIAASIADWSDVQEIAADRVIANAARPAQRATREGSS